ncbi:MAG: ATP-binding cassette domain-containing protein [Candidatus Competibacterales bacterium]
MLTLRNLSLQRGDQLLLDDVSLTIQPRSRVGIVGANGCGKSSLFALLRGELLPDKGDVELPPCTIAHVAQETPGLPDQARSFVTDGDEELKRLEQALAAAERADDGQQLGELHAQFDAIDGYTAPSRAERLLAGLGFHPDTFERPVAAFSGGWRVRLNLARALMCRSDLLLLDEPTNHLDLDAVLWLEDWLKGYGGTLLLISHDRDFLDAVADHVIHIEHRQATLYKGNYSAFERQRAERLALQQALFVKQQRQIAHLQRFVDRFRAKATKARQAQSRLKALDRMERIAAAHVDSPFEFAFGDPERLPNPLLQLDKAAVGYGHQPLLAAINLTVHPGTRLGLLGPNGAGKSTLIKLLAGQLAPLAGRRQEGQGLAIGYFAQHQVDQLRPEWSPIAHLQHLDPKTSEQALRDFVGGFDFRGDKALSPVAPFSGGEKARLALAMLVWQRPNLLLLDEPTNHLDLEMRHALNLALQDYGGALVVVSHDRHLLRTTTDAFWLVAEGKVQPFDGDLDDYSRWLSEGKQASGGAKGDALRPAEQRKAQRREEAERRQALAAKRRPLEKRAAQLERQMAQLEGEKTDLERALADAALYEEGQKDQLKTLLARQAHNAKALGEAEEAWLQLQEDMEAIS